MSTKECPSCGKVLTEGQSFCPACGMKIEVANTTQKSQNIEFESLYFRVNSVAEVCLNNFVYKSFIECENAYLELIAKFPLESRAYIGYVDFMLQGTSILIANPNILVGTNFAVNNLKLILQRCSKYLETAKEYASNEELEQILYLDNILSQKLESMANDEELEEKINTQQKRRQKRLTWFGILIGLFVGMIYIIYTLAE